MVYVNYRFQSLQQVPSRQDSTSGKENVVIKIFMLGITGTWGFLVLDFLGGVCGGSGGCFWT